MFSLVVRALVKVFTPRPSSVSVGVLAPASCVCTSREASGLAHLRAAWTEFPPPGFSHWGHLGVNQGL